ncbi:MAG: MarR family transcriptional regulator [Prolixibacteraceae bacterium]|nr:MarR family transcriptional regulator [Prolixibacteraceae bacterium]
MEYKLEELIDIILSKSEQLEDELKKQSDLKDLTIKQLHCIQLIEQFHNPTLSELAKKLKITKPSTTSIIDKLDEKGYVKKVKSDIDRRSAHIHLTEKGEIASRLHTEVHTKFAKLLTKSLVDSEKEILIVLLNKAVKSLK